MDSKQFGELALQLLSGAQIPGNALEIALDFKRLAEELAKGDKRVE